ncbi:MAG: mannose-1-phosphate guanylyltransferase [Termitinemataceae bacterium]
MFTDCIIMAGGSGTRLWPASNSKLPKQFLSIPGGKTFFDAALERAFTAVGTSGRVTIVTGQAHVPHVIRACTTLSEDRRERVAVIPEPVGRNTAAAIACAARYIQLHSGPGRTALVLTSDHIIGPLTQFADDALAAADLAQQGYLVVFGISPTRPETGFGYIEAGKDLGITGASTFSVTAFREKPDLATAEQFLKEGNFYWNSGMFAFSIEFILHEFDQHAPEVLAAFQNLPKPNRNSAEDVQGLSILSQWEGLAAAYQQTPSISIDYAIAEHCQRVAMVRARFNWSDVGSWDDYSSLLASFGIPHPTAESTPNKPTAEGAQPQNTQKEHAVVVQAPLQKAPVYTVDSANCFVDADIPVALCGVDDLIVVIRHGTDGRPATAMICKKGHSQQVKAIVEEFKQRGPQDLL